MPTLDEFDIDEEGTSFRQYGMAITPHWTNNEYCILLLANGTTEYW